MTCLHCQHNRPQRVSDGFYRAQCVLGYPEAMDACRSVLGGSTAIPDKDDAQYELRRKDDHASRTDL